MVLKVLGRVTSINVRKVLWTADELGLAYDREDWGLPQRDPDTPEFLALNPNGLVPVLRDGDFVLWESHPIIRYLAEKAGDGRLIPRDRQVRATMEQWLAWLQTELGPTWLYAFRALARPTPGYDDKDKLAESIARWSGRMAILEALLADGRDFVCGSETTLADIALGVGVHRWFATPFERPALPATEEFYARLRARPAAAPYLGAATP